MSRIGQYFLLGLVWLLSPIIRISNVVGRWRHFWWIRRTPQQPRNVLTRAILENDIAFVRAALEDGLDANTRLLDTPERDMTEGGRKVPAPIISAYVPTLLMAAASRGHLEMARLLLEFGADLEQRQGDKTTGYTALHAAAQAGCLEIVTLFLQWSREKNIADIGFETALSHAAGSGHDDVILLLLEHGAEINLRESEAHSYVEGTFPQKDQAATMHTVVNIKESGTTALIEAVYSEQESTVALLLKHGADVNLPGHGGETPLMAAASCNHAQILRILLAEGAALDTCDDDGHTALWWAKRPEARALLRVAGATK